MLSLTQRFEARYSPEALSGCWLWNGAYTGNGYPAFAPTKHGYDGAHRWSYRLHKGEIPEGLVVCHTCDNPACVNPEHLFLGTHKDNQQDCSRKGRLGGRVRHGENNAMAKLTNEQVTAIRKLQPRGSQILSVAKEHKVCKATIYNLLNRSSFK